MWERPWGYQEAWVIIIGILIVGYLWQFFMGAIPQGAFSHPLSTIILAFVLAIVVYVGVRVGNRRAKRRVPTLIRFLVSPAATITVIVAFIVLLLIMGLTTQVQPNVAKELTGWVHRSGWSAMVHSYPFGLMYLYFLIILGSITVYRIVRFRFTFREIGFVINHVGLFCFLFFALLSGGAMKRYTMVLEQDQVEWRGIDYGSGELVELPLALTLKSFRMEEYPPKLLLIDSSTGKSLLKNGAPEFIDIKKPIDKDRLMDWQITVEEFLPFSAPVVNDGDVVFKEFGSSGAAPSVSINARRGTEEYSGWVSCGSYLFPYRGLALADSISVVMPYPEPKQYFSTVEYIHRDGTIGEAVISVNDPLKTNGWYVYQLNYDQVKGRWATSSELELVYDPFIRPVLISIWVLLVGALFLMLGPANAPRKHQISKEEQL